MVAKIELVVVGSWVCGDGCLFSHCFRWVHHSCQMVFLKALMSQLTISMTLMVMSFDVMVLHDWVHELGISPFNIAGCVSGWLSIVVVMV